MSRKTSLAIGIRGWETIRSGDAGPKLIKVAPSRDRNILQGKYLPYLGGVAPVLIYWSDISEQTESYTAHETIQLCGGSY